MGQHKHKKTQEEIDAGQLAMNFRKLIKLKHKAGLKTRTGFAEKRLRNGRIVRCDVYTDRMQARVAKHPAWIRYLVKQALRAG